MKYTKKQTQEKIKKFDKLLEEEKEQKKRIAKLIKKLDID